MRRRREYDDAQKQRLEDVKAQEIARRREQEEMEEQTMKQLYRTPIQQGGLM